MRFIDRLIDLMRRIPYSLIALVARVGVFEVFWRSGKLKYEDWQGALNLFREEYKVPLLPPELAAKFAISLELGGAVLVLAGLATRFVSLAYLGMIAVIQIFVYPQAWPDHVQWTAMLLMLVAMGPGKLSLDALIARFARRT